MLITLHGAHPHIEYREQLGAVVVDFMMEKTWKDTTQEGVSIVSRERKSRGYLYRVSLHRPTIYTFNTVSRDSVHTWHSIYTIILMQGVEDEQDWVLEIADRNTKITLPIDKYDPGLVITDTSNRRSLWDHLEEDYDDV